MSDPSDVVRIIGIRERGEYHYWVAGCEVDPLTIGGLFKILRGPGEFGPHWLTGLVDGSYCTLIGDAPSCVSLMAGQSSALAMVAALSLLANCIALMVITQRRELPAWLGLSTEREAWRRQVRS